MKTVGYEISGTGWKLSFQRRVGPSNAANGGALPITWEHEGDRLRATVPLPDDETMWVALLCSIPVRVMAETCLNEHLSCRTIIQFGNDALIAMEEILRNDARVPISASTIGRCNSKRPDHENLSVTVVGERQATVIGVTFATPEYYELMTGIVVQPSNASTAYSGEKLP